MCTAPGAKGRDAQGGGRTVPLTEAVGMVLAHDITEIRKDEFKGRAFKKGHVIRVEDITHLRRLGKEHLFVLSIGPSEMHEDDAAAALAKALMGEGVRIEGEPREGKINLVADCDGLLTVDRGALLSFNMLGEVMCATRHGNSVVKKDRVVAGTRAIPLVIKRQVIDEAVRICENARQAGRAVIEVREMRRPKAGVVITGNEVYHGRIKDAFAPVISRKIEATGGEIVGLYYAPDDTAVIEQRLRELLNAGADLLITTGGMSVDPDDVTRFAIDRLGAVDVTYGAAVLPGAMFLVGYLENGHGDAVTGKQGKQETVMTNEADISPRLRATPPPIPILGIPACGMYHAITVFDLVLPRILAREKIGRRELAELGHGGLCLHCKECRYPVCPFGK
ncbi:MAG: molybdopterin-binding protein [Nitrospiraceae bacterium]|nr:molybdopterin-binding protein [Nitrospiraceae bacterium]